MPRSITSNILRCATKLAPQLLRGRVRAEQERVGNLIARARRCTQVHRDQRRQHFAAVGGRLDAAVRPTSRRIASASCATANASRHCSSAARVGVARLIERRFAALERADQLLAAFSYQGVLARGFALVRDPAGPPIRSAAAVSTGQALDIEFSDGRVAATATEAHGGRSSRASRSGRVRAAAAAAKGRAACFSFRFGFRRGRASLRLVRLMSSFF